MIDAIFQCKDLNLKIKDKKGNTPMHYAAFYRNEYLIQRLLEGGCNPSQQNKYGYTPLHMSLFAYDESQDHTPKIERMLLKAGADLNIEDEDSRTPFFMLFFKQQKS